MKRIREKTRVVWHEKMNVEGATLASKERKVINSFSKIRCDIDQVS